MNDRTKRLPQDLRSLGYPVCDRAAKHIEALEEALRQSLGALEAMGEALHQCLGALKALGAEKGYASQAAKKALGIEEDQS